MPEPGIQPKVEPQGHHGHITEHLGFGIRETLVLHWLFHLLTGTSWANQPSESQFPHLENADCVLHFWWGVNEIASVRWLALSRCSVNDSYLCYKSFDQLGNGALGSIFTRPDRHWKCDITKVASRWTNSGKYKRQQKSVLKHAEAQAPRGCSSLTNAISSSCQRHVASGRVEMPPW